MSQDELQNQRLRDIEKRISVVENHFSAITAELNLIKNLGKGIAIIAGTALGVDILPMLEG